MHDYLRAFCTFGKLQHFYLRKPDTFTYYPAWLAFMRMLLGHALMRNVFICIYIYTGYTFWMVCNEIIIDMRNLLLHFNLIAFLHIWKHIPQPLDHKAAGLILRLVLQCNLSRRSNRCSQRNERWDCSKESGELLKTNKGKVSCVKVLLMNSFGPNLFLSNNVSFHCVCSV